MEHKNKRAEQKKTVYDEEKSSRYVAYAGEKRNRFVHDEV